MNLVKTNVDSKCKNANSENSTTSAINIYVKIKIKQLDNLIQIISTLTIVIP